MTRWVGLALVVYVAGLSLLGLWLNRQLRSSVEDVSLRFAETVGREIALSLGPELADTRSLNWPLVRARVEERLAAVEGRSQLVGSLDLVGPVGTVIASSEEGRRGERRMRPEELFGDRRDEGLVPLTEPLRPGVVRLRIPVLDERPRQAYLELTLASSTLSAGYERGARRLMVSTVAGTGLLLLGGIALVRRLAARDRRLARALEEALAGKPATVPDGSGEFSLALAAAGRLGAELVDHRRKKTVTEQAIGHLSAVADVGLVALGADGRIELMNQPARELLGGGDGVDRQLRRLLARLEAPLAPLLAGTASTTRLDIELEVAGRSLQVRCEVVSVPCEDANTLLLLLRDREALEALEADLRDAAQLRGLAVLYLGMAHDLKAPLNAMALHIELLQRSLAQLAGTGESAEADRTKRSEWIAILKGEVERLARGLDTLVAQSALPRQGRSRFDLREMLGEVAALLAVQARRQGVDLAADGGPAPLPVVANADQVKQAILNLALNALEAQPDGGSLRIEGRGIPGSAEVTVRDAGPGIPPERTEQVFELRYSGRKGGLGVGLYVARSIVQSQGGSLEIAESGSQGTTFRLTLPAADAAPAPG